MSREKRIEELREILDHGLLSKEEFEKQKKKIEEEPEVEEKKEEQQHKKDEEKNMEKTENKKSDKILIFLVLGLILLFAVFFLIRLFTQEEPPETIDELHELNFKGKLKPDQGYVYNDIYSFIKLDDFWYTKLRSKSGKTLYNFNFRYSPRDLEDIRIKGSLDIDKFNNATQYFVTFNPLGSELTHIRLARLDYDLQMTRVFQKTPISACDSNVTNITTACFGIPVITCENTEDIVVYYKESDELTVEYEDNCITISGREFDLVKGVDRVLYNLYGIMDQ